MIALLLLASVAPPVADPLPVGAIARLGSARWVVGSYPAGLALSPDGTTIVTARNGASLFLDAQTGEVRRTSHPAPSDRVQQILSWNARRSLILACESAFRLALIDPTGKRPTKGMPGIGATWVGTQHLLTWNHHGQFQLVDADTLKHLTRGSFQTSYFRFDQHISGHPERPLFAYGTYDGGILVHDAQTNKVRWSTRGHSLSINRYLQGHVDVSTCFDPSGKWLASGGQDGTVRLWDADTGKPGPVLTMGNAACIGVIWADRDRLIAAFASGQIHVYQGRRIAYQLDAPGLERKAWLCVSNDGTTLAALSSTRCVLGCWDLRTGRPRHPTQQSETAIDHLQWIDSRRLLSADTSGRVLEWDVPTRAVRHRVQLGPGTIAFSGDNERLAYSPFWSGEIRILNRLSGEVLWRGIYPRNASLVSLRFDPRGERLIGAWSGDVVNAFGLGVWSLREPHSRQVFPLEPNLVNCKARSVSFHARGTAIYTFTSRDSGEDELRQMDLSTGKDLQRVAVRGVVGHMTLRPDGKEAAIVRDSYEKANLLIWNVDRSFTVRVTRPGMDIEQLAYSSCGRFLAGAGREEEHHRVKIWESRSGALLREFQMPGYGLAVAFSPNGGLLASAGAEGQILIWDWSGRRTPEGTLAPWRPSAAEWERAWQALGSADGVAAWDAAWRFASAPEQATLTLARHLRPAREMPDDRLATLLQTLDAEDFETRQGAEDELRKHGPGLAGQIERALPGQPLEIRRRLERLLREMRTSTEALRTDRALFALEQMGDAGRPLLYRLAEGVPEAEITQLARDALRRQKSGGTAPRDASAP